jgi:hypothetical protein
MVGHEVTVLRPQSQGKADGAVPLSPESTTPVCQERREELVMWAIPDAMLYER